MTTGLLIAFIGLLLNIGGATDQLTQAIPLLMNGAGGLGRIEDILSHEPDLADRPDAKPLAPMKCPFDAGRRVRLYGGQSDLARSDAVDSGRQDLQTRREP